MIKTTIIFILITGLLAKNYLIEVADEGGDEEETEVSKEEGGEEGSDFSLQKNFRMEQDGQFYQINNSYFYSSTYARHVSEFSKK